jgi:predicted  nucleic acid-binding Zn-ribbon protein
MGVRLEQVNALKSKNEIECCNICGRILYLDAPTTQTV